MMRAFLLVFVAVCFSVSGELLLKSAMNQIGMVGLANLLPMLGRILSHPRIWAGFAFFGVGAFFWLAALSRVDLSWAYPMLSLGYILVLIASAVFLKEAVSPIRWAGVAIICLGVFLVSRS